MIGIIDYGSGNVGAIINIFKQYRIPHLLSGDPSELQDAERYILPGVGAFDPTMGQLRAIGLIDFLDDQVRQKKKNILGICVGMQLLAESSEEGSLPGLGYISGSVRKIPENTLNAPPKLPHLGWNSISFAKECPLLEGVDPEIGYYFLHSYYFDPAHSDDVLATTTFGREITCAVWRENVYGVQFHPEKSHANGVRLLRNFATMT